MPNLSLKAPSLTSLNKYDGLTGVCTRYWFIREVENFLGEEQGGCLVSFDLVGFFGVNYAYGYRVGDALLRSLAFRLSALLGERVLLGRIRAKTFVAFLPGAREADAAKVGSEVRGAVRSAPFVFQYEGTSDTFSITIDVKTAVAPCVCGSDAEAPSKVFDASQRVLWERLEKAKQVDEPKLSLNKEAIPGEVFTVPSAADLGWPPVSGELTELLEALRDYVIGTAAGSAEADRFPWRALDVLEGHRELPSAFDVWLLPFVHRAGRIDFDEGGDAAAYALGRRAAAMRALSKARPSRDMARIAAGVLSGTYGGPTGNLVGSPDPTKFCRDTFLLTAQTRLSFICVDALARHGTRAPEIALEALEGALNHRNRELRFVVKQVIRLIEDESRP